MPEHHTHQVTTDKLEEAISHLSVGHTNLNTKVESIHTSLTAKIDSLIERFASISVPPHSPSSSPIPPPTPAHRHHMKLDVLRFDDIDLLGWIFKISQFFDYQGIFDHERLTVASLYGRSGVVLVSVDVQEWLLSFMAGNASSIGVVICAVILRRSARSIIQASADWHRLISELRREVQALCPLSLPQATELVRLQEDKMLDRCRGTRAPSHPNPNLQHRPPPNLQIAPPKVPLKRLMTEEMAVRHDQGLYYHCDDKWSQGHRCKPRLHLLIADEDLEPS
ncbi:hypothetical protein HKD37_07G018306 [Glycine soja]